MKQETLKEAAEYHVKMQYPMGVEKQYVINDFIAGANWQAEHINPLLEFVRDCAQNWDCDQDAHRYNTICRCCEAEKLFEQFKKK